MIKFSSLSLRGKGEKKGNEKRERELEREGSSEGKKQVEISGREEKGERRDIGKEVERNLNGDS
jgi:hypothetical protein